jgi:hypothetical protein
MGLILSGLILQVAGCAEESDFIPADGETEEREAPILAEVEIAEGHTIYFFGAGEEFASTVHMSEVAPSGAPSVMAAVEEHSATSLEVFLAVSPGASPPAELVTSHPREVEMIGRDSDDVKPFALPDVESRTRSSDCDSYSAFIDWWDDLGNTNEGYHYASGTYTLGTGGWHYEGYLGGCNKNGSTKNFTRGIHCDGSIFWSFDTAVPVSAGSMYYPTPYNNYPSDCEYAVKIIYPGGATGNGRLIVDVD